MFKIGPIRKRPRNALGLFFFQPREDGKHRVPHRPLLAGDREVDLALALGKVVEYLFRFLAERAEIPPEARRNRDIVVRRLRMFQKRLNDKEPGKTFAEQRILAAGAVILLDQRLDLVGEETPERVAVSVAREIAEFSRIA